MQTKLQTISANSIIKHNAKYYRVTTEGKAIDNSGVYALISPETEVEIVKTAEELATDYLKVAAPLNELGTIFKDFGNAFVQQFQEAMAKQDSKSDEAKKPTAKSNEDDHLEAAEAKPE